MFFKTVSAVITQLMIVIARAAVTAVMFFVTESPRALTAVVTVVAFPVIITPCAAVVTFDAVVISRGNGKRKYAQNTADDIFTNR